MEKFKYIKKKKKIKLTIKLINNEEYKKLIEFIIQVYEENK